ncbi:DoxX family protein [Leeuwenhoekiella sp. H156]|uniref:DoxX family protein n=1 Tax=Leeuwenhoekiella sp. H156 TaxID=3450128 RepID=UPI003FA48FB3
MNGPFLHFYKKVRVNFWHALFYLFCRCTLALGFIVAGYVKIIGERFASGLDIRHPMGAYLEALHHTEFYYPFIGVSQILAGILLVIRRTALLGALLYFPIIVNIWVLSWAVRFEGSLVTSTLMVLANLYILLYNYDRLKFMLPFSEKALNYIPRISLNEAEKRNAAGKQVSFRYNLNLASLKSPLVSKKFPWGFLLVVIVTFVITVFASNRLFELMPRNNYYDCVSRLEKRTPEKAGFDFCNCIHNQGKTLDTCLEEYEAVKAKN